MFCKKGDDDSFTTKGFDNLKKAVEKFRLLENSDTHLEARLKCNLHGGSLCLRFEYRNRYKTIGYESIRS